MWVYALVEAPPLLGEGSRSGVAGEPLQVVELPGASLRAVVGEVETAPRTTADTLQAHDAVVRRVAAAVDAVVPARFGQVVRDAAALDAAIAPRSAAFAAALALVRGCDQMTLRLFGRSGPGEEALDPAHGPGRRYLEARRAQWIVPELAANLPRFAPLVRETRVEPASAQARDAGLIGSIYHLVPRDKLEAYRGAFEARAAEVGPRRLVLSGPWPAYAFAPGKIPS